MNSDNGIFGKILAAIAIAFVAACSENQVEPNTVVDEPPSVTISSVEHEENELPLNEPVKPDTEQQVIFTLGQQMVDPLQISQDISPASSAKDVVTIHLNYPLFTDYLTIIDNRRGLNFVIEMFNGLKDLCIKIMDGVQEFVNTYKDYPNE